MVFGMVYNQKAIALSRVPPQQVNITQLPPWPSPVKLDWTSPAWRLTQLYSAEFHNSGSHYQHRPLALLPPPAPSTSYCPPSSPGPPSPLRRLLLFPHSHKLWNPSTIKWSDIKANKDDIWAPRIADSDSGGQKCSPAPTPALPTCIPPTRVHQGAEGVGGTGEGCCWQIACWQVVFGGKYEDDPHLSFLSENVKQDKALLPRDASPFQSSPSATPTANPAKTPRLTGLPPFIDLTAEETITLRRLFGEWREAYCEDVDGQMECHPSLLNFEEDMDRLRIEFWPKVGWEMYPNAGWCNLT